MHAKKLEFTHDVIHIVHDVCKLVFNLKTNEEVKRIFGISSHQLEAVIKKVIAELPDTIFDQATQKVEEIKGIFAREFIFFQVQEKFDDPNYEKDLSNFIFSFARDIQANLKLCSERSE